MTLTWPLTVVLLALLALVGLLAVRGDTALAGTALGGLLGYLTQPRGEKRAGDP